METHNPYSSCQFPSGNDIASSSVQINNFVYEPLPFENEDFTYGETYIMFIVLSGSASFSTDYEEYKLNKGDVFFAFPKKRYKKHKFKKAKLMYISFSGGDSKSLLESLSIRYTNPCKRGLKEQVSFCKKEFNRGKDGNSSQLISRALLYYLLSFFYETKPNNSASKDIEKTVQEILKYMNENCEKDISLDLLSKEYFISYNYLSIMFKQVCGMTFSKYLESLRMLKAKNLLKDKSKSVSDVCFSTGYSDVHYFCRVFKRYSGLTPSQYRSIG